MPKTKNQAKNKSRFEVRGGLINEFEFALNEGAMTEEEHQRFMRQEDERRSGADAPETAAPQTEAERVQRLMSDVHEKVARKKQKEGGATAAVKSRSGGSAATSGKAGKSSAKKAGAKKGVAKKTGAKSGTKKGASKKSSAGKSAARKSMHGR